MELKQALIFSLSGSSESLPKNKPPRLKIVKAIPTDLRKRAIEEAVLNFIKEVDVLGDTTGFFNQTLEGIANATFLNRGGDFWLAQDGENVAAYLLGSVSRDIDGTLVYWLSQAWVDKKFRRNPCVKEWWADVREQAKSYLCRHIVIVSARGDAAYCRWLGNGMHLYAHLLKEDI